MKKLLSERTGHILWLYFLLTYGAVLINAFPYLQRVSYGNTITFFFAGAVYLIYGFCYLYLVFIPVLLLQFICSRTFMDRVLHKLRLSAPVLTYGLAVLLFTLLQIFIFTDKMILRLYDFHINSFVWNLVTTRGGLESLGADSATLVSVWMMVLGFLALQIALLALVIYNKRIGDILAFAFRKRIKTALILLLLFIGTFQALTYGVSIISGNASVLLASQDFPFYLPVTFRHLSEKLLGIVPHRKTVPFLKSKSMQLDYPKQEIRLSESDTHYNIIWLVSESWRADMVDKEIMPQTWKFAQKAIRFEHHYSGGNGTRWGMFSMFYGLYGNYWLSFLAEKRGPVIIDTLLKLDYQMKMLTSAKFTYPEFNKTLFSRIDQAELVEGDHHLAGWENDRKNVAQLLDFIETRDRRRPFMTFMFFESPHAKYYFPPETAKYKPYLKHFDYTDMDLEHNIALIKNRYLNSCCHLDTQFDRIFTYLKANNLLDSTIVLVTGDHGEEFMEKGHWGHNSTFSEEQVRVPLILYVPGQSPRAISRMTSHLDIPATIMTLLGVENPPEDYSLGFDLLGNRVRNYSIIANWNSLCSVDQQVKVVLPLNALGFAKQNITTVDDQPISGEKEFYQQHVDLIRKIMQEMKQFSQQKG